MAFGRGCPTSPRKLLGWFRLLLLGIAAAAAVAAAMAAAATSAALMSLLHVMLMMMMMMMFMMSAGNEMKTLRQNINLKLNCCRCPVVPPRWTPVGPPEHCELS